MVGIFPGCSGLLLASDSKRWMTLIYHFAPLYHPYVFASLRGTSKAGLSPAKPSDGGQLAPFRCCFPVLKASRG